MPKFLERKLATAAAAKGKTGRAADRYIYGALNNMGAMRGNQETAKGRTMDAKHARDMKRRVAPKPVTAASGPGNRYDRLRNPR